MVPSFVPTLLPAYSPEYIPPKDSQPPVEPLVYGSIRVDVTDYRLIRDTDKIVLATSLHTWPVNLGPLANYTPGYEALVQQVGVGDNVGAASLLAIDIVGTGVGSIDDNMAVAYYEGQSCFYILCQPGQAGRITSAMTNSAGMTCTPLEMLTLTGTVTLDGGPVPNDFYEFDLHDLLWDYSFVFSPVDPTYTAANVPAGTSINGVLSGPTSYNTYREGIVNPIWNQEFVTH